MLLGMSRVAGARWRILVVEDDALLLGAVSRALERLGHATVKALTAEEALALLATQEIDAVISDIGLPGMSGTELLATVLRDPRHRALGMVLWSGSGADTSPAAHALQAQGVEVLSKPAVVPVLVAALERALASARER